MPKVIITVEVQDPAKWEAGFRSHGEIFRTYSVNAPISYTTAGNQAVVCMEVASAETMQQQMALPATADAMGTDGLKRETFKMFVLDKQFTL
jgi:hypothetical protein